MKKAFTIIEIVIVIALMAILAGTYFLVANPGGQLASSRNSERKLQLQAMMNAIEQNIADQSNAEFSCSSGSVPTTTMVMKSGSGGYNIGSCLVPTYLAALPFDPASSTSYYSSPTDYNTGYAISINSSGTLITLTAPAAELGKIVSVSGW